MKATSKTILGGIVLACFIYFAAAWTVFGFRHPWATDTERLLYTLDAIRFRHVPYERMRPR